MDKRCQRWIVAAVFLFLGSYSWSTASTFSLSCKTLPVSSGTDGKLTGKYRYSVSVGGGVSAEVKSHVLILDRSGNILRDVLIQNGDVVRISTQDAVTATRQTKGAAWQISGPSILFRAEAKVGQESAVAYCSPFAAIRLEQPVGADFVGESSSSPVPVRFVGGFALVDPKTLKVHVDGVDLTGAVRATFPGGPISGVAHTAGGDITISELATDDITGNISFTLSNLPNGPHRVSVSGSPAPTQPAGSPYATSAVLKHERTINITRPQTSVPRLQLIFVQRNLRSDQQVSEIREIVRRASEHGYNGVVLSASFDVIGLQPPEYFTRLAAVKTICTDYGMELIPLVFSTGYGGILPQDRNLAEGLPVKALPLLVKDGAGVLVRDPAVQIVNGGFERYSNDRPTGIDFNDAPGVVSFIDTLVSKEGKASLRFENFQASRDGMARLIEKVSVKPFRCYQVTCWLKTEGFTSGKGFSVQVLGTDDRVLMMWNAPSKSTQDWQEVRTGFNSLGYGEVRICAGTWGGRGGKFWIDDLRLSEVGLLNVLRRPGAPIKVTGDNTGVVHREGVDFERIKDPNLSYKFDHNEPVLRLLPGSNIGENQRLRVDYYQGLALKSGGGQVAVCLSEPKAYEIWGQVARSVDDQLDPKHYFISSDEIRHGGWCEACQSRSLSSAELLGDCITRQVELIHNVNPTAEVIMWSDMLDPNQNATADYFLFNGDLRGSWEHVPRTLIIACWNYKTRNESLRHFDQLGFRTLGCGYYDSGNLDNATGWAESLKAVTGACGIMYTTWKDEYNLLESFGDVVHQE